MDLTQGAALLDEIAREQSRVYKIGSQFKQRSENPRDPFIQITAFVLGYPVRDSDDRARNVHEIVLRVLETEDSAGHPDPCDLRVDVLAAWEELVTLVQSPVVAARLRDLLWSEKFGDQPHKHARAAIQDYIAATKLSHREGIEVLSYLERALGLSREIKASEFARPVGQRASEELVAEYECHQTKSRPGVVLGLLRLLLSLDESDRPAELRTYFDEAHRLFSEREPRNRAEILQLQEALASDDPREKRPLQCARVDLWVEHARQQEPGLARLDALRQALEAAEETGQPADVQDSIRRMIGQIDEDDIYTEPHEVVIPIPPEMKEYMDRIVGNDGIGPALDRLGSWWPPTGDPSEAEAAVDEQMDQSVILSHFSEVILDGDQHPIRYLETYENKRTANRVQYQAKLARLHAVLAVEVLHRIGKTYSPGQQELIALFQTESIELHQAEAFARSLGHFWAGRFDEAIHIALPRIEAVLRGCLAAAGGVIWNPPQRGTRPNRRDGSVKSLGDILQRLSGCMREEQRALCVLLTDAVGLNLRNRYLHGLVTHAPGDPTLQQDAALILWIAARLRLLQRGPAADSPPDDE